MLSTSLRYGVPPSAPSYIIVPQADNAALKAQCQHLRAMMVNRSPSKASFLPSLGSTEPRRLTIRLPRATASPHPHPQGDSIKPQPAAHKHMGQATCGRLGQRGCSGVQPAPARCAVVSRSTLGQDTTQV